MTLNRNSMQQVLGKAAPEVMELVQQAQQANSAGDPEKALQLYSQAIEKARTLKDRIGEAGALYNTAGIYRRQGQTAKAIEYYQQAAHLYHELGSLRQEGVSLNFIGTLYVEQNELKKSQESFEGALRVHRANKDAKGEAMALSNLGVLANMTGQPLKALEYLEQSLSATRALGDTAKEAEILSKLGDAYQALSQPQKALEFYLKALPTLETLAKKTTLAQTVNNLGNLYDMLGQPQKALEFYQRALPLFRDAGERLYEANVLNNMAILHKTQGQPQRAQELFGQAGTLYRALGNKVGEATVLHNQADSYLKQGQTQKALAAFQQALTLFQALRYRSGEGKTLTSVGKAYSALQQPQKALPYLQQALAIHRETGERTGEISALSQLALTDEQLKRPASAETHYAQAIESLERLRTRLGGLTEAKSTVLAGTLEIYYRYLQLLLAQGKGGRAFEVAQQTKARSLLDLMAAGRVDLSAELRPAERQELQALRERADTLNQQMVKEGVENEVGAKQRYAALKQELQKTESQLQTLTDTLYAAHPRLAQAQAAKTVTLSGLATVLPPDTALLEYVVLSEKTLALFVATRSGVKALTLSLSYPKLVTQAATFRSACADPRKDYKPLATELHRLLLAPAAKHLTGAKRLVICPDGALWDVPFQALLMNGQFLAQRYEISYAYSATGAQAALTVKSGHKQPTQTLLALANPDFGSTKRFGDLDNLPGQRPIDTPSRPIDTPSRPIDTPSRPIDTPSRPIDTPSRPIDSPSRAFDSVSRGKAIVALPGTQREADALKKLFPTATLMTGSAAQEGRAKLEASKYKYLHFATHGFFNDAAPLLSSLVLAQPSSGSKDDGFLTAREIFDLDLSAEMVVLSACNTARGVQRTGDGVIGLTWALFVAGCPTQVVSQWAVDDASTATLMAGFYGNLATKKQGKGAALRQASLTLMSSPKHAHPYYWAPFVLMGDWR